MDLKKRPLIEALFKYQKEHPLKFHMPGHRNETHVASLMFLQKHLYDFDVTEVNGTDNLHAPESCIQDSQKLLAEALGAKESFYCVNGSTAANYAMVFGLLKPGDEVLLQRNSHQSLFRAMSLRNLRARFLVPQISSRFPIPLSVELEDIIRLHKQYPNARAVILTSPNYYGLVTSLEPIAAYCKDQGLYLLVDEAHGAHFAFSRELPPTAMLMGAHTSSVSFHKTLPVLTQGAVLNLSDALSDEDRTRIRYYLKFFQTSSPSYTLLASMENARALLEEEGETLYHQLIVQIHALKLALEEIPGVEVLSDSGHCFDITRLVVKTPIPGEFLGKMLRKEHQIQCEMTEGNLLVFILSPYDSKTDLLRLSGAIRAVIESAPQHWKSKGSMKIPDFSTEASPQFTEEELLFMSQEEILLSDSTGRISAESVTPYPPGVPYILPGEQIGESQVLTLTELMHQGQQILKSHSQRLDTIRVLAKKEDL